MKPLTDVISDNIKDTKNYQLYQLLTKFKVMSAIKDEDFMRVLLDLGKKETADDALISQRDREISEYTSILQGKIDEHNEKVKQTYQLTNKLGGKTKLMSKLEEKINKKTEHLSKKPTSTARQTTKASWENEMKKKETEINELENEIDKTPSDEELQREIDNYMNDIGLLNEEIDAAWFDYDEKSRNSSYLNEEKCLLNCEDENTPPVGNRLSLIKLEEGKMGGKVVLDNYNTTISDSNIFQESSIVKPQIVKPTVDIQKSSNDASGSELIKPEIDDTDNNVKLFISSAVNGEAIGGKNFYFGPTHDDIKKELVRLFVGEDISKLRSSLKYELLDETVEETKKGGKTRKRRGKKKKTKKRKRKTKKRKSRRKNKSTKKRRKH